MATATVGIRGLGAEDIKNAQPNLTAVALVESLRLDAMQARQFATTSALTPLAIDLVDLLSQSANQIDQPQEIEIDRQLSAVLLGSKPLDQPAVGSP